MSRSSSCSAGGASWIVASSRSRIAVSAWLTSSWRSCASRWRSCSCARIAAAPAARRSASSRVRSCSTAARSCSSSAIWRRSSRRASGEWVRHRRRIRSRSRHRPQGGRAASGLHPISACATAFRDPARAVRGHAILSEVTQKPTPFEEFSRMSPSGAELLRQVKSQIEEVDPAVVAEHLGNGVVARRRARDRGVRRRAHLRAPSTCRAVLPRDAHRGRRARPRRARRPLLRLRQPLGAGRRARSTQDLGYENVASMTGGIALWKDRGYEVDDAASAHAPSSASATRATC